MGGNIIRNTMSDRKDQGFEVYPFYSVEDGYRFKPMERRAIQAERLLFETAKRKIVIQIEVWTGLITR